MRMQHTSLIVLIAVVLIPAAFARAGVYAHYSFDADYTDDSGNARHGTLVDVGTLGNTGVTTTAGQYVFGGGALNLATDRDYIDLTSTTFGSGSAYSIAFWAKKAPTTTGDDVSWDMVIGDRNNTVFFIAPNSSGDYLRWRSNSGTDPNRQLDGPYPASFDDEQWHHYAVTASTGGILTIYIDGDVVASASKATGFTYNTIGEAYTSSSGFDFYGQIDEVWILNQTLGVGQVRSLLASNVVPAPAALPAGLGLLAVAGLRRRR